MKTSAVHGLGPLRRVGGDRCGGARRGVPAGRRNRSRPGRCAAAARRARCIARQSAPHRRQQLNMFVTNYGSFACDIEHQGHCRARTSRRARTRPRCSPSGCGSARKVEGRPSSASTGRRVLAGVRAGRDGRAARRTIPASRTTGLQGGPLLGERRGHGARRARRATTPSREDPLVHHSWSEYMRGARRTARRRASIGYRSPNQRPRPTPSTLGPDVSGDQMLWAVYNDADPASHTNDAGSSPPLGVEVQQTTFALQPPGRARQHRVPGVPDHQQGRRTARQHVRVAVVRSRPRRRRPTTWSACDTTLSLGFIYNATNNDQLYGSAPPAVGYDFFQGPRVAAGRHAAR